MPDAAGRQDSISTAADAMAPRGNLPSSSTGSSASTGNRRTAAGVTGAAAGGSAEAAPPAQSFGSYSDRFIPLRAGSSQSVMGPPENGRPQEPSPYLDILRTRLLSNASPSAAGGQSASGLSASAEQERPAGGALGSPPRKLMRFKNDCPSAGAGDPPASPYASLFAQSSSEAVAVPAAPPPCNRVIPPTPWKVLDAPQMRDDYYLNLVDWSSLNVLAVGLGNIVYLWSPHDGAVTRLCNLDPMDEVSSVAWASHGNYLAIGTASDSEVQIWDAAAGTRIRTMTGHRQRVGTLAWNSHILSSGSRDRNILHRDVRAKDSYFMRLLSHRSEVCGLKWSYDKQELASGGNDNKVMIWNLSSSQPVVRFRGHTAAVKPVAWSPHHHRILATGGGTTDRCIRLWKTSTAELLNCIDTGSQVCNMAWSKNVNEIVSTHGFSQNQIIIWQYPQMTKLATLTGHTMRVLHLAVSPDGQTIVTGAGDETLRFWNCFPAVKTGSGNDSSVASLQRTNIR